MILKEKGRLNIPDDWIFYIPDFTFIQPRQVTQEMIILQMGPAKIPVAMKRTIELEQYLQSQQVEQVSITLNVYW